MAEKRGKNLAAVLFPFSFVPLIFSGFACTIFLMAIRTQTPAFSSFPEEEICVDFFAAVQAGRHFFNPLLFLDKAMWNKLIYSLPEGQDLLCKPVFRIGEQNFCGFYS